MIKPKCLICNGCTEPMRIANHTVHYCEFCRIYYFKRGNYLVQLGDATVESVNRALEEIRGLEND